MLKIQEIREIIKLIDQSSIEKFTFESEGTKIKFEKASMDHKTPFKLNRSGKRKAFNRAAPVAQDREKATTRASTCRTRKQGAYSKFIHFCGRSIIA